MATVFEDRSTHDPAVDSVATLTLTVECNPGEVSNLSNFLVGVAEKAGVYSVSMDHVVAVEEKPLGEAHGEQQVQQADSDGPGAPVGGQGSVSAEGGAAEVGDSDELAELAVPAGSGAEEGPSDGDS